MIKRFLAAATAAIGLLAVTPTYAANLFINGDFETGSLAGWSVANSGSGTWGITTNGGGTPINGFPTPFLASGGSFNAHTDQNGPGSHGLSQSISLANGTYNLSFDYRANDQSGSGGALDQEYVVRIDGIDILGPILNTDWLQFSQDFVLAAGIHTFTFFETDDRSYLAAGLDNVNLSAAAVPEPATLALVLAGLGLAGVGRARRRVVA